MKNIERSCRKFIKRHGEALFIAAFLLADCLLSGWALTIGSAVAVIYVLFPALNTVRKLDAKGRITFVKAFLKTPKFQRLSILLFWIWSIRFLLAALSESMLFPVDKSQLPSLTSALITLVKNAKDFAPLAFLLSPIIIYATSCAIAIFWRSLLKASNSDPDLIEQRKRWAFGSQLLFYAAYVASILTVSLNPSGPAYMFSNWLLASARDANFYGSLGANSFMQVDASNTFSSFAFVDSFDIFAITTFSSIVFLILLQPMLRFTSFLLSFCWRVIAFKSLQNIAEAFLETLRLNERTLAFPERHPLIKNGWRSIAWVMVCYMALLLLCGFCGGPLGLAIQNWMIASGVEAGFSDKHGAAKFLFSDNYRVFLASVVALYGAAPLAVTASVFLPFAKARKISLNCDGISFFQGPYFSLFGRQTRLWSDLQKLELQSSKNHDKNIITMQFRSGGIVRFDCAKMQVTDFRILLDAVDRHASSCEVSPEIFDMCQNLELKADAARTAATDGGSSLSLEPPAKDEFKSTVFVPFSASELLPGTKIRVIKQLASKPLCAVYLARDEHGKMQTVKQFYLADETEETKAFTKILQREYELLSKLKHPGIAKVSTSFKVECSTFLLIEHRPGTDVRSIVKEHGARSEGLVISWAKSLCEIMIYLHNQKPAILHRDLTPDNIVVGEDGQLRLIDFGAAREYLDGITGTMIGKQCYVAPEQLRGDANQRSDIYSFGCTLYFAMTGRDPRALSQSKPADSVDCSDALDQLIRDCTDFDESKRPQSFEEVQQRLLSIDSGFWLKLKTQKEKVPA